MNKRLRHIAVISVCAYLLIVSCSERTANTAPTIILSNGHIWTGKDSLDFVEAIAITGNKITQIGTTRSIGALAGPNTKIIDLQGNLVTAGFNDAHIHFLKGSLGLTQVELSKAQSLDDMITITQKFVR